MSASRDRAPRLAPPARLRFATLAIGRARGVALRTIANQLASMFKKLGVSSRVELAALLGGG